MIVLVFLITVLIVFVIQWYIEHKKFYKFADGIPMAKNYGILGHGPHFLGKNDEGKGDGVEFLVDANVIIVKWECKFLTFFLDAQDKNKIVKSCLLI